MRRSTLLLLLAASLFLGLAMNSHAQTYDISWYKIAGGGGTSTGSVYTVSGTIGQPDAGTLVGGPYSLTGGFWGIIAAVQTPGSPFLTLRTTNNTTTAVLSWPSAFTGFTPQQSANPASTNWVNVNTTTFPITVIGGSNTVTLPVSGNQFFRLTHP
ncbi:MAG: hypothetical protein JWQ04_1064 [Pedosphaera sp.]|nr:hypothetical protein [Pedosphaera sp.]